MNIINIIREFIDTPPSFFKKKNYDLEIIVNEIRKVRKGGKSKIIKCPHSSVRLRALPLQGRGE
jgi:hypothetical protein